MGLKDLAFLTAYNKAEHNIAEMFYLPCMRNSVQYDRISGYFGSTIFIIAWDALQEFVENHGTMRIVCHQNAVNLIFCLRIDDIDNDLFFLQKAIASLPHLLLKKLRRFSMHHIFPLQQSCLHILFLLEQ